LGRDATPAEADLPRFIDLEKEFHGKDNMVSIGVRSKCVTLLIDGPSDADPWGREVLYAEDGTRIGRLTSGGYSVAFEKSIGMGYVKPEYAVVGSKVKVKILDQLWDAVITEDSPYDPKNTTIRVDG
jgi:dimethylglycine dehydrogenase